MPLAFCGFLGTSVCSSRYCTLYLMRTWFESAPWICTANRLHPLHVCVDDMRAVHHRDSWTIAVSFPLAHGSCHAMLAIITACCDKGSLTGGNSWERDMARVAPLASPFGATSTWRWQFWVLEVASRERLSGLTICATQSFVCLDGCGGKSLTCSLRFPESSLGNFKGMYSEDQLDSSCATVLAGNSIIQSPQNMMAFLVGTM
eukprot:3489347-Amphidinium_carterae.1